jgi:hypothetical protein
MKKEICISLITLLLCSTFSSVVIQGVFSQTPNLIDPQTIPKWVNQLYKAPPIYVPNNVTDNSGKLIRQDYVVGVREFMQQILPVMDSSGNPTGFGSTKFGDLKGKLKMLLQEKA